MHIAEIRRDRPLRVVKLVANMKRYRPAFYTRLAKALEPCGVELTVLYSDPNSVEATKRDCADLAAPVGRKIGGWSFIDHRALLQFPPIRELLGADLIIVVQAAGYLLNYPLLFASALGLKRVAFWGHGRNLQGDPRSPQERLKRRLANASDWWFSHTRETKRYLVAIGVAPEKITPVENAIDTRGFRHALDSVSVEEIDSMRSRLAIPPAARVGLYCGSLYGDKRIDFLLESARHVTSLIPEFRLLIVGDGPERERVMREAASSGVLVYPGAAFDRDKAVYFRMADIFLNPGMVGLGILDSFAAGLPLITTQEARHSPEIAYLVDGDNGRVVSGDASAFAGAVAEVLGDRVLFERLRSGARAAADRYTLENMVENVKSGILECLGVKEP